MKLLILAHHFAVASGRYYTDAFRRLGHTVKTVGEAHGSDIWGVKVQDKYVWEPTPLDEFRGWMPDAVLLCDSMMQIRPDQFPGVPHIVLGVDNHARDYTQPGIDHYFLAHKHGPCQPVIDRRSDMTWLPCGYDPVWHKSIVPIEQREFGCVLLGFPYDNRVALVDAIEAAGWPVVKGMGAVYDEYVQIYNSHTISLCASAFGDVAQRIFESAAMGNVIVSDRCPDMPLLGLIEGVHYLGYDTPQEAVEKIEGLLAEPPRIKAMSEAVQTWVIGHSWDDRARIVIDKLERMIR